MHRSYHQQRVPTILSTRQRRTIPVPALFDSSNANYNAKDANDFFKYLLEQRELSATLFSKQSIIATTNNPDVHYNFTEPCLYQRNNTDDASLHFISGQVGKGGFAEVYDVSNSYIIHSNDSATIDCFKIEHPLVLKAQHVGKLDVKSERYIKKEHSITQRIPHLAAQDLAWVPGHVITQNYKIGGKTALFVMNKMKGNELYSMLYPLNKEMFTLDFCMKLTEALLNAVKTQISAHELVHHDLKPENIIVNIDPLQVNIIDYGLATEPNSHCSVRGTVPYLPQEAWDHNSFSSKIDVFSIGRIIAEIFGGQDESYLFNPTEEDITKYREYLSENNLLNNLFNNLKNEVVTKLDKARLRPQIKSLLKGMLAYNPNDRLSIDQAITQFKQLNDNYKDSLQPAVKEQPLAPAIEEQPLARQPKITSFSTWRNYILAAGFVIGAGIGCGLVLTGVFAPFGVAILGIVGAIATATGSATVLSWFVGKFVDYIRQKSRSASETPDDLSTREIEQNLDTAITARAMAGLGGNKIEQIVEHQPCTAPTVAANRKDDEPRLTAKNQSDFDAENTDYSAPNFK